MEKRSFHTGWSCNGKAVILPHDAMLSAPRRADASSTGACAYFEGGVYKYQKTFTAPKEWEGMTVLLQFEGVYRNTKVFLNGVEVGGAVYGYIPFFVKLTGLHYSGENVLEVTADNSAQPNSRWYTGGGIYRPVNRYTYRKEGLRPECVQITTLSYAPAKIQVETTCSGHPKIEILDGSEIIAGGEGNCVELDIPHAKLWSDETPNLYTCRVSIGDDVTEETFGIRKIEWNNKGLFINGKETLLRGGCIHHDSGILGAATYKEAEWRRVKKLKEAGYNALRISHNPASTALLEACDHYGLYVIDETWDVWYQRKNKADYALDFMDCYKSDIQAMISRDFNHPSVIMYSIGNEVSEPATQMGVELAKEMISLCHQIDDSRPATGGFNLMIISRSAKGKGVYRDDGSGDPTSKDMSGMNSMMFNMITNLVGTSMNRGANSKKADVITSPLLDCLDICGYNYASGRYPLEGKVHPDRVIFGSETFPQDIAKNWAMVKKYPYLIGDFMWTAWDYLGEAGAGAWAYTGDGMGFQKPYPWLLADMGAMDILGDPNGELFWAQAVWGLLKGPKMAVQPVNHPGIRPAKSTWRGTNALPSWSWQGCEGHKAVVEVYFDCARVDLFLNGKKLGSRVPKECRATFKTKYIPGMIEAVAYDAMGRELGRCALETAKCADIHVQPEKDTVTSGEICYVPISIGDGTWVECNADRKLTVTIEGGELLGFGSANPRTEERFLDCCYTTYYGRAMVIFRANRSGRVMASTAENCIIISVMP